MIPIISHINICIHFSRSTPCNRTDHSSRRGTMSSGSSVIYLCESTGKYGACINGAYESTSEIQGGFAVHMKRGDAGICIEHNDGIGLWQVKHVSDKGTRECMAMVSGKDTLQACAKGSWRVYDERRLGQQIIRLFTEQPNVKMLTGIDAERKVGHPCTHFQCFTNLVRPRLMRLPLRRTTVELLLFTSVSSQGGKACSTDIGNQTLRCSCAADV
jgi:hypothetical protein